MKRRLAESERKQMIRRRARRFSVKRAWLEASVVDTGRDQSAHNPLGWEETARR